MVISVWLLVAVAMNVAASVCGGEPADSFSLPGSETEKAMAVLETHFPDRAASEVMIVVHDPDGVDTTDPTVTGTWEAVEAVDGVMNVTAPLPVISISSDGTIVYATVGVDENAEPSAVFADIQAATAGLVDGGYEVSFGGQYAQFANPPHIGGTAELIGLGVAVVVLAFTFGSLMAMAVPLLTALVALATGLGALRLISAFVDIPEAAPTLATMIGLGVGIDYALFVITRYRMNRAAGMSTETAAGIANATAGNAVVFAGGTVIIAICGLVVAGIPMVTTMGLATAATVLVTVVAAVTLLPAVLGALGDNLERGRVRRRRADGASGAGWRRWARRVGNRPWTWTVLSLAALLIMAAPTFAMRLGMTDAGNDPPGSTTRVAYERLSEGFGPGFNGPFMIVTGTGSGENMGALAGMLSGRDDVAFVSPVLSSTDGAAHMVAVVPATSPQDQATTDLIHEVRASLVPAAGLEGEAHVGGATTAFLDLTDRIAERLGLFILIVVGLSFVLLMIVFRSILVPLKAAVMNLLSIGAAYGVCVAMFQWGWGKDLIGLAEPVPIISFVPMMMFAILFGLSMDYEVFLLSRIREEWVRTGDNQLSVEHGLADTGRVITSAALIMISVFGAFALIDNPIVRMMGIGLAVAVAVDATIVRVLLVPASMALLGKANWWLPRWLDRVLPTVDVEGHNLTVNTAEGERDPDMPDPQVIPAVAEP